MKDIDHLTAVNILQAQGRAFLPDDNYSFEKAWGKYNLVFLNLRLFRSGEYVEISRAPYVIFGEERWLISGDKLFGAVMPTP